jgi:tRNA threonylcarbamoyladenosine biosynthesis protein TsaB
MRTPSVPSGSGPSGSAAPGSAHWRGIGRGFAAHPGLSAITGLSVGADDGRALPQAREMLRLGAARLEAGGGIDPESLEPLYVRDKVALTEAERGIERTVGK